MKNLSNHGSEEYSGHAHAHTEHASPMQGRQDGHHGHEAPCSCGHTQEHHGHQSPDRHVEEYHGQEAPCSCEHGEKYHRQESSCGHGHHGHEAPCSCGHTHSQEPDRHYANLDTANGVTFTCLVENLGCANCAAKMERRINSLPEVNAAVLTFATKQLRVAVAPEAAKNETALIEKFQEICASIEPEATVCRQQASQKGKQALQKTEMEISGKRHWSQQKTDLISIIIGALLFASGELLGHFGMEGILLPSSIFIIAYCILGRRIVLAALKNLCKGRVFDEN